MVSERYVLEHHAVVILVKGSPPAVLALHGENPIDGPLHRFSLIAAVRVLHVCHSQADHCTVVHIRIELVVKFEIPARRLPFGILNLPVADRAHLLLQNPVRALYHPRIVRRHPRFAQCKQGISRVPDRRFRGLHPERIFFLDTQLFEFIERADDLRIIQRVAQAAQRDDRIQDRWIDCPQSITHLEARQHPLFRLPESDGAQRANMHALSPVRQPIQSQEKISPRDQPLGPVQMHARLIAPAHKQFLDPHLIWNLLERLLGITHGKRHQNGPRPRGNLVDIEPEPVRKQHDLRGYRRHRVIVILAEEAQVNLGERIYLGDAAQIQNLGARAYQCRMVGFVAAKLEAKISLHRSADIRRACGINAPSAVFVLISQDVVSTFSKALRISRSQQRVQQNVIRLKRGIRLELAAPVAFFVLLGE